jgi:acetolactate synthase I/II/III large subunit
VLVRHEQAAVHAADGYARATGEVGVALVTSGPGVTNAVTGIATAYMDSIPMVIITGQVPTPAIGLDAFQECDTVGITRPIVKHNFLVKDVRDLALTMKKAFHIARTGRPGPVVVDIPKDVSLQDRPLLYPTRSRCARTTRCARAMAGRSARRCSCCWRPKRPYIYTGGGVILGECFGRAARAGRPARLPLHQHADGPGRYRRRATRSFLGMLGMHGTYEANMTMQHCDVLLAVGARFDDRVIGNPKHFASVERKIIHRHRPVVDLQAREGGHPDRRRREGRAAGTDRSDQGSPGKRADPAKLAAWWNQINEWRKRECLKYKDSNRGDQAADGGREALGADQAARDAYITSDVGQHQMWAAQYYRFEEPRRWINSGGLGTMGVGLPYAMGIKLAKPDADVFCITGEGSIQMCIQELSTCKQYNTPVKVISLNNRYLGMVRQWQQLDYGGRYSHSYMDALPDFVKLAEAYGHVGMKIEKPVRRGAGAARSDPAEGPHRVPRHPHRPDRKRLADGAGRQGHLRDAAGLRRPVKARIRRLRPSACQGLPRL